MARLALARITIAALPFARWRHRIGGRPDALADLEQTSTLARHVEWAARWVPFETQCLARALALSSTLRRKGLAHVVVFAARPIDQRTSDDTLHAWVEVDGQKVIGNLPGPWIELLRCGHSSPVS